MLTAQRVSPGTAVLVNACHAVYSQNSILKTVAYQDKPEVLDPEPLSENMSLLLKVKNSQERKTRLFPGNH